MDYTYAKGDALRFIRCGQRMTQENICERVCSTKSLSLAENGRADISDDIFESLMKEMGCSFKTMPDFRSKEEYDVNNRLNKALFDILSFELNKAEDIIDDIRAKNMPLSTEMLQKFIAIDCMIYVFSGAYGERLTNNLIYALSLTGKEESANSPCGIREFEIYLLLAFSAFEGGKKDGATEILEGLRRHCPYFIKETEYTYNHLYVYYKVAQFLICDHEDQNKERSIADVMSYARANDDGLAVLLLSLGLAKAYLNKGNAKEFHNEICTIVDMAEFMECPFRRNIYKWIEQLAPIGMVNSLIPDADRSCDIHLPSVGDLAELEPVQIEGSTYNIWNIIKEERTRREISAAKLAEGICSQSKISKMETGKQGCDVLIIHSLLQRLEIEDEQFTFFVSQKEYEAYMIMRRLNYYMSQPQVIVRSGKIFEGQKIDPVRRQLSLIYESYTREDMKERASLLSKALLCTRPNFDISSIENDHFTDAEWKCLVDLTVLYCIDGSTDDFSKYYFSLTNYMEKNQNLSKFKRKYAIREIKKAFVRVRDYRMVRILENKAGSALPKTSYRRYKQSVDNLITCME